MSTFNIGWYLIYTRPKHEKKVTSNLAEYGIEYFSPLITRLRTWSDRRKFIEMPLFPSYVFVYLRDMNDYYDALTGEGAIYYVKFDKKPVRIHEEIIEAIRLIAAKGTDVEVSTHYIKPGQRLIIHEGPLTGLTCEVVELNGKQKILVRVHLLQRSLLATLPMHAVREPSF